MARVQIDLHQDYFGIEGVAWMAGLACHARYRQELELLVGGVQEEVRQSFWEIPPRTPSMFFLAEAVLEVQYDPVFAPSN